MTKNNTTLEIIAPTVEEAIEKGLEQLGVERKDVEVEVMDDEICFVLPPNKPASN